MLFLSLFLLLWSVTISALSHGNGGYRRSLLRRNHYKSHISPIFSQGYDDFQSSEMLITGSNHSLFIHKLTQLLIIHLYSR